MRGHFAVCQDPKVPLQSCFPSSQPPDRICAWGFHSRLPFAGLNQILDSPSFQHVQIPLNTSALIWFISPFNFVLFVNLLSVHYVALLIKTLNSIDHWDALPII